MNRYMEALALGILATVVTFVAGVGASRSSRAGTPAIQIAASDNVELRPRISGRILSINFVLEQQVSKGDVLLTIDPAPYQAAFNKARTELAKAQWRYVFALRERSHQTIEAAHGGSREDLDSSIAFVEQAQAAVAIDKTALEVAQANLDNTKVLAPISGTVGLSEVAVGSLVEGGRTRLTTLVPLDSQTFGHSIKGLTASAQP